MSPESDLLRQYVRHGDEAAFAELVRRHLTMVYSVAWRVLGSDAHLAQDICQKVFADLARQAPFLCHRATLGGWLHTSARFAAGNAAVSLRRLRKREQEAATMQQILSTPEVEWEQLRPVLDEAIGHLNARDRDAVVLRFFHQKSHREISEVLGLTENGARMRVERAVEKLRDYFSHRGIKASAALLATAITTHAAQAVPAGLVASVAGSVMAGSAKSGVMGTALKYFLTMNKNSQIALAVAIAALSLIPFLRSAAAPEDHSPTNSPTQNQPDPVSLPKPLVAANNVVAQAAAIPAALPAASNARTLAPAPPPAPAPVVGTRNGPSQSQSAGASPPAVGNGPITNPASPPNPSAPAVARPLGFNAATLPSHNVRVRVYGELYAGYAVDVTFIGMGQEQREWLVAPTGGSVDDTDLAAVHVQVVVSASGDAYRVEYFGALRVANRDPVDHTYVAPPVTAHGEVTLQAGASDTAQSSEGNGSLTVTLSEIN